MGQWWKYRLGTGESAWGSWRDIENNKLMTRDSQWRTYSRSLSYLAAINDHPRVQFRVDDLKADDASYYTFPSFTLDPGAFVAVHSNTEGTDTPSHLYAGASSGMGNTSGYVVLFDSTVQEFHGFKPLTECSEVDYNGCVPPGGMTALYDAVYNGVQSMVQYGRDLMDNDFDVNGAVFVITDGMDNSSSMTRTTVKQAFTEAITGESLESLVSVLIGVNTVADGLGSYLRDFKDEAGFTQYVEIADATEKQLAKLGAFISQSISSQSQSLGTGGPSKSLSF